MLGFVAFAIDSFFVNSSLSYLTVMVNPAIGNKYTFLKV